MASIKILLRDSVGQDGLYPIVLRIIKDRKTKTINVSFRCAKKDWDMTNSQFKKSHPNFIQRNMTLLRLKEKAYKVIDEYTHDGVEFTLNQFEAKFRNPKDSTVTVRQFWEDKINNLNVAGRTGNARAYKDTMQSFFKYINHHNLVFREITVELLYRYETFLRSNGGTNGGIGVKMRELRAIFNSAIREGIVDEKYYPFKKYKVSQFKSNSRKIALTRQEVRRIENLSEQQYPYLSEAKRLFIFSYYNSGMNYYDMMLLKWTDIRDGRITYTRSKTKGKFSIRIEKPVEVILNYYRDNFNGTNYVFPILLKNDSTPVQIENRKAKKLKQFNLDLRKIAVVLKIEKPITSYVARHSFASNMKEIGISIEIISQSMGHTDVSITNAYLSDFDNTVIDEAKSKLL